MVSFKDIKDLFGARVARIALIAVLLGIAVSFAVSIYTGTEFLEWARRYFHKPLSIKHLMYYQAPPAAAWQIDWKNNKKVYNITGIKIALPLKVINRTSQTLLIDGVAIEWASLKNFGTFKNYNEIMPESIEFKKSFEKYEGGYIKGNSQGCVLFKSEEELQNWKSGESMGYFRFPIKLAPYEDNFIEISFELDIFGKEGQGPLILVSDSKKEGEEFFIKLIPMFFGAEDYNDLWHDATFTFKTNMGPIKIRERIFTLFVGTQLRLPDKEDIEK